MPSREYEVVLVDGTNDTVKILYDDRYFWFKKSKVKYSGDLGDTVKMVIPDELALKAVMIKRETSKELLVAIDYPGDPSVGIFSGHWEITGGILFKDKDHRELIREAVSAAFEEITGGGHYVTFSDEWEKDEPGI